MSIFFVVLLYAMWSSVFSFAKIALSMSPPLFLTAVRMLLAALLLFGFLALRKRSYFTFSWRKIIPLLGLGFFSIYLTNILEFWGLQYLTSAKVCLIYSLSPLFAALFSYLHFKETITLRKWVGMSIALVGTAPVIAMQTGAEELFSLFHFLSWPSLAIVGAAMASVYGWVLLRLLVKNNDTSPLLANSSSMLFGGILALIHSLCVDNWHPIPVDHANITPFLLITALITLVSNLICYNLYGTMLKKFTATFLSFVGLLSPIFASLHGFIFLHEKPSWMIFVSTAIISFGLYIVYAAELKQGYVIPSKTPQPIAES